MFDPFGMFGHNEQREVPLATEPFAIRSLPVPRDGAPADFTGAVGNFTMSMTAGPTNVAAGDPITGYITASENELKARIKFVNDEVAQMEVRVNNYEAALRQQWATLESTIGTLKTTGDWLTQQVASMSGSKG